MEGCAAYCKAKVALRQYFGFESFRPGQLAVLHGKDVFAIIATGAGKSLCFLLIPLAVSTSTIGVVISPLNALQVVLAEFSLCFDVHTSIKFRSNSSMILENQL